MILGLVFIVAVHITTGCGLKGNAITLYSRN